MLPLSRESIAPIFNPIKNFIHALSKNLQHLIHRISAFASQIFSKCFSGSSSQPSPAHRSVAEAESKQDVAMDRSFKSTTVKKVEVLSQSSGVDAQHCGLHAFKNALIALGVFSKVFEKSAFQDVNLLTLLKSLGKRFQPNNGRANDDATIAELTQMLQALANNEIEFKLNADDAQRFAKLSKVTKGNSHAISLFNLLGDKLTITDATGLQYVANLYQQLKKPDFCHAFAIGDAVDGEADKGHWVTLVLYKESGKQEHWEGMDSWHNKSKEDDFKKYIKILQRAFNNPIAFAKSAYFEENRGLLKRIERKDRGDKQLLEKATYIYLLGRLEIDLLFLERMDWLQPTDDEDIQKYRENIKNLVKFYLDESIQDDRLTRMAKKLGLIQ